jgi:hypothetical protein
VSPFQPSDQVAAFASAAYTAKHATSLITDQTSIEMACDAIKEAIIRSLPLTSTELALANLMRDQDELPPPTLPRLLFDLQAGISKLRASGALVA